MIANMAGFRKTYHTPNPMLHILSQMLLLFGIVMVGFFSTKTGFWKPDLNKKMSHFVLNVSCPMLILSSVMGDGLVFSREEIVRLLWVSVVNYAVIFPLSYLVTWVWRQPNDDVRGQLRFMAAFGNVTFVGFPAVAAIFGDRALFYAAVLTIPFNLLMYTIGEVFIAGGKARNAIRPKRVFSPCVIAAAVTVVLALSGVHTPPLVARFFHLGGDMTIPVALIIVGSTLASMPKRAMLGSRFAYATGFVRLMLVPAVVYAVLRAIPAIDAFTLQVAVVLSGMPIGVNGVMFCLKFNKDERLMAQSIFLSTALSMLSIPVLAMLVRMP